MTISSKAQEFVNSIFIPPIIESTDTTYHLNVIETQHNFNPNGTDSLNTLIKTFAFENAKDTGTTTILGPTIAWQFGKQLSPQVTNNLTEVTTGHWHGAHVPQEADGGPHQRIQPGTTWMPQFEVMDKSATMWYHPHAMDLTYKHVQMGLSGMIYVEDPLGADDILEAIHRILPVSYGVNDFPLIFQTKKFERDSANNIQIQAIVGYKKDYVYLVNGIKDPVLNAPADMVRLRILNGDGKFSFDFTVTSSEGSPEPFQLIATDAGYTNRTYELDEILMAPGERTEWLLDLRGRQGDTLYIRNKVSNIPTGVIGDSATTKGYAVDRNLLRIIVGQSSTVSPIIDFPINLHPTEAPSMSEVTHTRLKTFRRDSFLVDNKMQFLFNIDSTLMDMMVVNDVVKLDSTEIWTIDNQTDIAHPWHIHDIHFYVTEIIDENGMALNPTDYPQIFAGPKDNVLVMPGWKLSYIATFGDFGTEIAPDSSYMYHCHILPHEDKGMMGQFVVWNGQGDPPTSIEEGELSERPMKLFPNPTKGQLFLEGSSEAKSIIRIFDVQGRLLSELDIARFDGTIMLNVEDLPKGMVILEWLSKEGRGVQRVILK